MFSMSFDPASMKEIALMYGFPTLLSKEVQSSLLQGGELLQKDAVANTWQVFQNPTGQLASTIVVIPDSPFEIQIGTDSPYGHRREEGFGVGGTEATDSMGRVYHDRGYYFMKMAFDDDQQQVLQFVDTGVANSLGMLGG